MSWYDPTSWDWGALNPLRDSNSMVNQRKQISGQGDYANTLAKGAAEFAGQGQGAFNQLSGQGQGALAALLARANGQNSVSAEQLRQSLQQNLAAQRSLAASASPRNAAMAARTAAIQSGRLGAGLAGQQAVAGLQERNQAQDAYGSLLQGLSGQQLQAALGSRQNAISATQAATQAYGGYQPEKSTFDKLAPAVLGGIDAYTKLTGGKSSGSQTMSDRLLKTDVKPGDGKANAAIAVLQPYSYSYKDPRLGAGPQVGVMAQDLERAGLKHAVVDTPMGKAIDAGKLSGANTAMIAALGRRVAELEQSSPDPAAYAAQQKLDSRRAMLEQQKLDARRALLERIAQSRRLAPLAAYDSGGYPGDTGAQ